MKITKRKLSLIIESLLREASGGKEYICPKCGHKHEEEPGGKCANCGHKYDDPWQGKKWTKPKEKINEQKKEMSCPVATTDISVNTANRDRARKLDWIMYGPLNVEEPGDYWKIIADKWNTVVEAAKKSNCGNCVAFDRSPKMVDECIPAIATEPVADKSGVLGYCWMHHFKCHSARTCNTWAAGGPIKTDVSSRRWMKRNSKGATNKSPIDQAMYKDDTD